MAPVFITNIAIYTGTDFAQTYLLEDYTSNSPLNLTGYTAAAQMRKTYESSSVSATFTTSIAAADGQVTLTLTDTVTTALSPGRYVYDLVVTDGSSLSTRVVEGQAIVTPGVTRS